MTADERDLDTPMWVEETGARYRRHDGAVVRLHTGPSKLQWIAYEPDPSENYLIRRNKRGIGWPRRWRTAEAAMRTVDKEYPSAFGQQAPTAGD